MRKFLLLSVILLAACSCSKKGSNNSVNYTGVGISNFDMQKAYMECSVYSYNNRCTDFRSNRRLVPSQFYDHRCFGFYKQCLLNRGVTYTRRK